MKKILITGALGQDGIILSKKLKNKFNILGLSNNLNKKKIEGVNYIVNNLSSKKKILRIFEKFKPDIVFHLASKNNPYTKRKKESFLINYKFNYDCSKNLIDAIIEKKINCKFIFAGSSLMFGNMKKKVNEKDIFKSSNYYAKYKIDIYKYLNTLNKYNFFKSTTAILFNHDSIYRGQKFLIPRLIVASNKKNYKYLKKIFEYNISGDFSHADDVCDGLYKLTQKKKMVNKIILSSNKRIFINDIIIKLNKNFKFQKFNLSKKNPNKKFLGSNSLAKKFIKYQPKKDIFDAVDELNKKYKDHFK